MNLLGRRAKHQIDVTLLVGVARVLCLGLTLSCLGETAVLAAVGTTSSVAPIEQVQYRQQDRHDNGDQRDRRYWEERRRAERRCEHGDRQACRWLRQTQRH